MEETKLTAALPNLDVEIVHRAFPERNAEAVSITFTATPDFRTASRWLAPQLPLLALWAAPLQVWSGVVRQAWAPWLEAMAAGSRRLDRK